MSTFTGLTTINSSSINTQGNIRLGSTLDSGTPGQVIISNGELEAVYWGNNSASVPSALTMGSNISLTSGNPSWDGLVAETINSTSTTYTSGSGISIVGTVISTNPSLPLSNSGGNIILNYHAGIGGLIVSAGQLVFNPDTTTIGINGVAPHYVEVLKVPNILNINGTLFDGSSAVSILTPDTTYIGGIGINIDITTTPKTINTVNIPNSALTNSTISGVSLGSNLSTITFYTNSGGFITSYNGANPPTSITLDGDTTYSAGDNINIGGPGNAISLDKTIIAQNSIEFNINGTATTITGSNYPFKPTVCTYLDLTSNTNILPSSSGPETLKSISFVDNVSQNYIIIPSTSNRWVFDGSNNLGSDQLEVDFTATSTHGYLDYGFYANSYNPGVVFCLGVAAATGGTSPFSTTLSSSPVYIDAYKLGLFNGSTSYYSMKEILDFDGYENVYTNSNFFFNNLTIGTRYRMAIYGRVYSSGSIIINAGGKNSTGYATRGSHQPTYLKFYEYDSTIGGIRN